MDYSWSQFLGFLRATQVLRREDLREELANNVISSHGDEKTIKQTLEDLKD